jgi:hypothetical protein
MRHHVRERGADEALGGGAQPEQSDVVKGDSAHRVHDPGDRATYETAIESEGDPINSGGVLAHGAVAAEAAHEQRPPSARLPGQCARANSFGACNVRRGERAFLAAKNARKPRTHAIRCCAAGQGRAMGIFDVAQPAVFRRRAVLALGVLAGGSVGRGIGAQITDFRTRPVRIVVPYTPGGTTDIATRLVADPLSKAFGQPVAVENRPGREQHRGRGGGRVEPARWPHLGDGPPGPRGERDAAGREDALRSGRGLLAGVAGGASAAGPGRQQARSRSDASGISRLRQAEPGQGQPRLEQDRCDRAPRHGAAQAPNRRADGARPLPRHSAGAAGAHGGQHRAAVRCLLDAEAAVRRGKHPAAGHCRGRARRLRARPPDDRGRRDRRVRRELLVHAPRARRHAAGHRGRLSAEVGEIVREPAMAAELQDLGFVVEGRPPGPTGEFLRSEVERWDSVIRSADVAVEQPAGGLGSGFAGAARSGRARESARPCLAA